MKKRTAWAGFAAGLTVLAATLCSAVDPMFEVSVIPGAVTYIQQRGETVWMAGGTTR